VRAPGETFGFGFVTSDAFDFGDLGGMREILDGRMTILAAENRVRTGTVFCAVDG